MSKSGFSLLQVIVSIGILGMITVSTLQLISIQMRSISYLETKMSIINLEKELISNFENTEACKNSIQGAAVSTTPQDVLIKDHLGTVIFDPGSSTNNTFDKLKIKSIKMTNKTVGVGPSSGSVNIKLYIESLNGNHKSFRPINLLSRVITDSSSNVLNCNKPNSVIGSGINGVTSTTVVAGTCTNGIKVEMYFDAKRNDGGVSHFKTFRVRVNGLDVPHNQITFGAVKGGSSGHSWEYRVSNSISFFVFDMTVDNLFSPAVFGSGVITNNSSFYHLTCI